MARHAVRTELGGSFSEGARQLWLRVQSEFDGKQVALAAALKADPGLVSRWLYGDRMPSLTWSVRIHEQMGIAPAEWGRAPAAPFLLPGASLAATGTAG
jgi:hypothetical protein